MFCPSCGAEVPSSRFCENCGSPLPAATESTSVVQPADPASAYASEVPGDSAWEAQPQQAYQNGQVGQTGQMPPQPNAASFASGAGASQPPYQQAAPYKAAPPVANAPNAAFVLVIVGLVLSVLFVTFVPGLVCSIVGLVLNAGYNKKGLVNPRTTATTVLGVIGIVVAAMCVVFSIAVGVVAVQAANELDRRGFNIETDSVEVVTDSSGNVNISVNSPSSASSAASAASSSAAAGSTASASSASGPASASVYEDAKYHDAHWNPAFYSLFELTGAELSNLLEYYNFTWSNDSNGWLASDNSRYAVYKEGGLLSKSQVADLPKGAAGESVAMALVVEGYSTPADALKTLSADVTVETQTVIDGTTFAVVHGTPGVRYLVVGTGSGSNEQTFVFFTEESIKGGLFESFIGVNAGSSIDEVWKVIAS